MAQSRGVNQQPVTVKSTVSIHQGIGCQQIWLSNHQDYSRFSAGTTGPQGGWTNNRYLSRHQVIARQQNTSILCYGSQYLVAKTLYYNYKLLFYDSLLDLSRQRNARHVRQTSLLVSVFVKLNQNNYKYWDGNAVYCRGLVCVIFCTFYEIKPCS